MNELWKKRIIFRIMLIWLLSGRGTNLAWSKKVNQIWEIMCEMIQMMLEYGNFKYNYSNANANLILLPEAEHYM